MLLFFVRIKLDMSSFVKRLKLKNHSANEGKFIYTFKRSQNKIDQMVFLTKAIYSLPLNYLLIVIQIILIPQPSKKRHFHNQVHVGL